MIRYPDLSLRVMPLRRVLDRMLEDMAQSNYLDSSEAESRGPDAQTIPVNIFQTADHLVLVAPMPGVESGDIEASVTADTVYLRAELRGPHQENKNYIAREWSYGPYERTIRLPCGVDAEKANASFNNGLLVLNLPKRDVTRAHRITLDGGSSARGLREVRSGAMGSENESAQTTLQAQAPRQGQASSPSKTNPSSGNGAESTATSGSGKASRKKAGA